RHAALAGASGDGILAGELYVPGVERRRRELRYALVERVQRSAMDLRRPRRHAHNQQSGIELGSGLRQGLPDPDVPRRDELDDDLLHDDWHWRSSDAERLRQRALRADVRDAASHAIRLLAVGIPGLRHLALVVGRGLWTT